MGKARKIMILLLLTVCLFSATIVLRQMSAVQADAQTYEALRQTFSTAAPTETAAEMTAETVHSAPLPKLRNDPVFSLTNSDAPIIFDDQAAPLYSLDLAPLQSVNPEVIGWILIGGTEISYPLVQHEDNSHYLTHSWDNQSNRLGSIFLECQSSPDLTDFHTLVYGHNMENGTMFSDLKLFADSEYLQSHPYIYIVTAGGVYRYEIFSFYEAAITDQTYQIGFVDDAQKLSFLEHCVSSSLVPTGISPDTEDRIITLSTCTNYNRNTRFVLQARLEGLATETGSNEA